MENSRNNWNGDRRIYTFSLALKVPHGGEKEWIRKRFLRFVDRPLEATLFGEPEGAKCWLWKGCVTDRGYGRFKYKDRSIGAHRIAYVLWNGPIPQGAVVHHTCHEQLCVNPGHLGLMTHEGNVTESNKQRSNGVDKVPF